jgi:hypothetical protein
LPKFQSKSLDTPARLRLGELIETRVAAAAEVTAAQSRLSRLTTLADSAAPIRAKLAKLDADEAAAFAAWAKGAPDAPPPAAADRTDLTRELSEAVARTVAATRAIDGMRAEVNEASAKANAADQALNAAVAMVGLELLPPIAAEAQVAMATVVSANMRGQALVRILGASLTGPSAAPDHTAAFVAAGESLKNGFFWPRFDEASEFAFMAQIRKLMSDLRSDAGAKLDEAA